MAMPLFGQRCPHAVQWDLDAGHSESLVHALSSQFIALGSTHSFKARVLPLVFSGGFSSSSSEVLRIWGTGDIGLPKSNLLLFALKICQGASSDAWHLIPSAQA